MTRRRPGAHRSHHHSLSQRRANEIGQRAVPLQALHALPLPRGSGQTAVRARCAETVRTPSPCMTPFDRSGGPGGRQAGASATASSRPPRAGPGRANGGQSRVVVARQPAVARVVHGLHTAERGREGPQECEGGARPSRSRGYAQADSASSASGTRPLTRWSPAEVPGCGCTNESSSTCSAIAPIPARNRVCRRDVGLRVFTTLTLL
jgi:hypothetical protein